MNEYRALTNERSEVVAGHGPWTWVRTDSGAWDGPVNDWLTSHSTKYFKHIKDYRGVVTAGANCGLYARQYADMFETVWAFEPDSLNFHCLVNNCQLVNVIKLQAALGAECKTIAMNNGDRGNVGTHTIGAGDGVIPMLTVDSLNLPYCSLLQLDIEGYEYNALLGAEQTIAKYRPVIVAERGQTPDIVGFMQRMRYEVGENSVSDTVWIPLVS